MKKFSVITVQNIEISIATENNDDYICLTDMVKSREGEDHIRNWMRNRNTIEFLGTWEVLHNPAFKGVEFDTFLYEAGANSFNMTPRKWIEATNAVGIISKAGRNGGTYAHKDIAFEFGTWLSPVFKLYLITEYQRLKEDEQQRLSLEWNLQRTLAKVNYRIHTDAVKSHIIPPTVTKEQANMIYASEADLLNVALFGKTAQQWRSENPKSKGNIRDEATLEQLVVLSNLESINALLIRQDLPQRERLIQLNQVAITQLQSLLGNPHVKRLSDGKK